MGWLPYLYTQTLNPVLTSHEIVGTMVDGVSLGRMNRLNQLHKVLGQKPKKAYEFDKIKVR